uniref:Glycoside hydrolase family 19 catalytic domain-containing protein n=1 Tax=Panagrolaimus sp. PS1159 TaxID=55785 RepID=A0AC35G6J6_9BILA
MQRNCSTLSEDIAKECFYRGGLYHFYEGGPRSSFFPSSNRTNSFQPEDGKYCIPEGRYCNETPETKFWYPCDTRNITNDESQELFKSCYFGRGPFQLSWNYNYGQFQHFLALNDIKVDLLSEPHLLLEKMDPPLAMLSAIWFYMTPQPPKPSMHDIIMGRVLSNII